MIRDDRDSRIAREGSSRDGCHEARGTSSSAPDFRSFESRHLRRLVQGENGHVLTGAHDQPRDRGNAVGSDQVRRENDDRHDYLNPAYSRDITGAIASQP